MAATKAQRTKAGRTNYGRNKGRGDSGESAVKKRLECAGYTVTRSPDSRGWADLTAKRGRETRRIQVKNITSRRLLTASAARQRMKGRPFGIRRIPSGGELWVFDRDGRQYVFGGKGAKEGGCRP